VLHSGGLLLLPKAQPLQTRLESHQKRCDPCDPVCLLLAAVYGLISLHVHPVLLPLSLGFPETGVTQIQIGSQRSSKVHRNEQGSRYSYRYELSNVDIPIRRVCPTVPGTAVVVVLCTRSYSNTLIWRLEIENDPFARPGMNVQ
jgi:hypothetical protein